MADNSIDAVRGRIYCFGVSEPNLTSFIRDQVSGKADRVLIDVGANVMHFSLLTATLMLAGKVVSIEIFPSIYEKLRKNNHINRTTNVRIVACAATEHDCEIEMFHGGSY